MSKFYTIWDKYGEKIGLGTEMKVEPKTALIDADL
jgi:hypothetical protein